MKVFYLYIIRKFLTTFVFIIALFVIISVVFDISERIDDFVQKQAPLKEIIFSYYLNFIPYFINLFSPLFIFISAIYFTSRMAANSEFIAILTSGASFYRLLIPYMIAGMMLASLAFYLNGYVIPHGTRKKVEFEYKYVYTRYSDLNDHIHRQIEPGVYMYIENWDASDSVGFQFALEKFKGNEMISKLQAQTFAWDKTKSEWLIRNYSLRTNNGFNETYTIGKEMYMNLPIEPADFGRKTSNIDFFNNRELNRYIKAEKARGESLVNFYLTKKYQRSSQPFATFILIIIAFSISSRKIRGGTGLHLGLGILIAFTYLFFMQFSTMFAIKGDLDPLLAVWLPNIVFSVLAFYLLLKAQK